MFIWFPIHTLQWSIYVETEEKTINSGDYSCDSVFDWHQKHTKIFRFLLAQIELVPCPGFPVSSGFRKMANSKKSRDNVRPYDFLYAFHQVLMYSNQSLEKIVQSAQGRWQKIWSREVTFCKKLVTSFSHQWYVKWGEWHTKLLI